MESSRDHEERLKLEQQQEELNRRNAAVIDAIMNDGNGDEKDFMDDDIGDEDAPCWQAVREEIVLDCLRQKFRHDKSSAELLLSTKGANIVNSDIIYKAWGTGVGASDVRFADSTKWPGCILYGKLLQRVRDEIQGAAVPVTEAATTGQGQNVGAKPKPVEPPVPQATGRCPNRRSRLSRPR